MPYTKKRVFQHIMEDRSIQIVRELLPEQWVVREYRPDYGIDLTIELFEYIDDAKTVAATLGETLFVQVKSVEVVTPARLRVYGRRNVEIGPLREDRTESTEIEVARLRLETSALTTVQAMGSAVPVLLFLVELSTRRLYFLCLNDLVEKVILPADPDYARKQTKTINIPLRNRVTPGADLPIVPLRTYAKRPKLYAAFEKFGYQSHEVGIAHERYNTSASEVSQAEARMLMEMVRHFLAIILRYDFWTRIQEWEAIEWAHRELLALEAFLGSPDADEQIDTLLGYLLNRPGHRVNEKYFRAMTLPRAQEELYTSLLLLWRRLDNLSAIYEEMVREWFLPTHLATLLSPDLRGAD